MSLRFTLSRWMYGARSRHAPDWQNLPTMSVEKDRPTSGPPPAAMAVVILSSSCPSLTTTLIFGWDASKSSTTPWLALDSRSVKKCQNVIVPDACAPGDAIGFVGFVLGVHAAAAASIAAPAAISAARRARRWYRCRE